MHVRGVSGIVSGQDTKSSLPVAEKPQKSERPLVTVQGNPGNGRVVDKALFVVQLPSRVKPLRPGLMAVLPTLKRGKDGLSSWFLRNSPLEHYMAVPPVTN